jgi:hypothetical protein
MGSHAGLRRRSLGREHAGVYNMPAYTRLGTRVGWRIGESLDLSVTGANLLQPRHAEFPGQYGLHHTEVARQIYAKVLWRF